MPSETVLRTGALDPTSNRSPVDRPPDALCHLPRVGGVWVAEDDRGLFAPMMIRVADENVAHIGPFECENAKRWQGMCCQRFAGDASPSILP
jgi:hypothetical protein